MITIGTVISGGAGYTHSNMISMATVPDAPDENRIIAAVISALICGACGAAYAHHLFPTRR